jgi:hypothetical protein
MNGLECVYDYEPESRASEDSSNLRADLDDNATGEAQTSIVTDTRDKKSTSVEDSYETFDELKNSETKDISVEKNEPLEAEIRPKQ